MSVRQDHTTIRGHNGPAFRPRIPGTDLRSEAVPTARIYRPARAPGACAPRPRHWVLEFEPWCAPTREPLMGWISGKDSFRPIRMRFADRDSAVDFAMRNDWRFVVQDAPGTTG
ncbi:MAG: ETC complex I subunit [Roseovarius sp.]|nr:ETC complex I subunit [Roseovarius sp.]